MPILLCFRTLITLGMLAAAPSLMAGPAWAGHKDCQFIAPGEWQDSSVVWDGACAEGKAHGQGVLRGYRKGASTRLFFGAMKQGQMNLGVIEVDGGYLAGEFVDGTAVPNPERSVLIRAFNTASAAANGLAQRLKIAKKNDSSTFYLKKAQELQQQLD